MKGMESEVVLFIKVNEMTRGYAAFYFEFIVCVFVLEVQHSHTVGIV